MRWVFGFGKIFSSGPLAAAGVSASVCKTHAAGLGPCLKAGPALLSRVCRRLCDSAAQCCASLAQGKPESPPGRRAGLVACALLGLLPLQSLCAAAPCPGPVLQLRPLAPGVWWVPGQAGDADANNRGQVANLVLVRERKRLWALGSGPSPVLGAALGCQVRRVLGLVITDVVSPWARPELVLGVAGLRRGGPGAVPLRHWAHAAVAEAMQQQCARCVDRLRQRLQAAADDLGSDLVDLPDHWLHGEQGRLGPLLWWRLPRDRGRWITLWRLRRQPLWVAQGLLIQGAPPDGREADLALLQQSSQRLAALASADGAAARFVGEQGEPMDHLAAQHHADYWEALRAAVAAAMTRGADEAAPAPALVGWPDAWASHPSHALNWQRAWRQAEADWLAAPQPR